MGRRRGQTAKAQKAKAETPPKPEIEEETYFLNPDAVSPHLYCCICQEVFKEPWRAPCGHSFCKKCIFDWLSKNSICPTDRKPVTVGQLHHDFLVQSIIEDYVVACPWRALGCDNVGPLHLLKDHKKVCPLNPNNMPKVLQDYSVQVLSTAQQELQRKQVQRSLASTSRQSLPSDTAGPPARQSTSNGTTSAFDQLLSEELERGDSNDGALALSNSDGSESGLSANQGASASSASRVASASSATSANQGGAGAAASSSSSVAAAASAAAANSSFEDDEANLPDGNLPSIHMRLYMSDRNNFVNFLENMNSKPTLLEVPKLITRYGEPSDRKRSRLESDEDDE